MGHIWPYTNHRLNGNHCCLCFPWSPLLPSISHYERKKVHHCCRRIALHQGCCHLISLHQGYDSVFSATRCKKLRWQEMSSSGWAKLMRMKEILALDILWTPKVWMWEEKKCLQRHICIGHFLKAGAAPKQSTSHRNQGPGGKILKVRNIHRSSFHNFVISLFRYFTISLFHYFVISIFSYFIFSNGQRWNRGEWNVLFCKTTATRRGSFPSRK